MVVCHSNFQNNVPQTGFSTQAIGFLLDIEVDSASCADSNGRTWGCYGNL